MMTQISIAPDVSTLEIPMDAWTKPFWDGTAQERIVMPRCVECGTWRWPAGPFCPQCSKQAVDWTDTGPGRIYSYTIVPGRADATAEKSAATVPALIEFPAAGGM